MINAKVRGIFSVEMDELELHVPLDTQNFSAVVRVMVGPRDGDGEESFDINVCSPEWLKERVELDGFALGLHRLFIESYDPARIRKLITKFVEKYSGESWQELGLKLSRIAYWEFQDHRFDSGK
jgi:hypothetical protein